MKNVKFVLLFFLVPLLLLSGCWQANICSSNDDCVGFECALECEHEKACVNGKCECKCIPTGKECVSDSDCEKLKNCGIYPNKSVCLNGQCKCEYECKTDEDCANFPCLLECKPSYNYCESGVCACDCETEPLKFSPWHVNEMKEDLLGKIIVVAGEVEMHERECSSEECEGECCHSCTASLKLVSGNGKKSGFIELDGAYQGKEVNCSGNECEMECWPLEIENTYAVKGLWKKDETVENGNYYLMPLSFELIEKGKPKIISNKKEYGLNEEVRFSMRYGKSIYFHSLKKPHIYKKKDEQWLEYNFDCGCVPRCDVVSNVCEKNLLECDPRAECVKVNAENVWNWNQEYCELEEIDCQWQSPEVTEKIYCFNKMSAGAGTYKVAFTYFKECPAKHGEELIVYSNEFEIKEG